MAKQECKYETEINGLLDFRLISIKSLAKLETKMTFMCIISLVIFTSIAGQIVLMLFASTKAHEHSFATDYSKLERGAK